MRKKKRSSLTADDSYSSSSSKAPNTGIMAAFGKAGRKEADQAILNWLASSGLPPYAVEGFYFKEMLKKTRDAGPTYQPPDRRSLGQVNNVLGHVLQEGVDRIRELRSSDLVPVQHVKVRGCVMRLCLATNSSKCVCTNSTPSPSWTLPKKGTLCSDGARNIRRDALAFAIHGRSQPAGRGIYSKKYIIFSCSKAAHQKCPYEGGSLPLPL